MDGPIDVEFAYSVALTSDSEVRLVLDLPPSVDLPGEDLLVRLTDGRRKVRAPGELARGEGKRPRLTATFARSSLSPGTWQISVRTGGGSPRRVRARVLVVPGRPIALLPGPPPRTRITPPRPRMSAPAQRPQPSAGPARRAVRSALSRLPQRRADQVRTVLGQARALRG